VLDPAIKQIVNTKKQRERIYDDDIYFVYSKPSKNTPEWACDIDKVKYYEDTEMTENSHEEYYDETDPKLDFILNSAEMNLV
jgi:hypothetical protein